MILQAADRDEGAMYTHPPPRRNGAGTGKLVPDGVLPQQQYQTHVFAPVVTGAPTKKASLSAHPSITVGIEQKIYPPTNEQGQRICRSCGQPGRYKEDKCVEKWGPGPMGPGTVCDRCRKKMKRFERRGTLGASQTLNPQLARNNLPQPQLHPSPSPSHPSNPMPRPSSSSSSSVHHSPTTHRASPSSVHRSDTIIVPSLPPIAVERDTPSVRRITPSHSNGSGKESDADADADGEVDEIDADGDIDMRETQVRTVGLDKSDKTDKDRAKSEDAVAAEPGEPEESVVDDLLEAVDAAEARG
ncbi:uncharacterized protein EV420DRAFT_31998 [Desarmillaria tabescens]|uniref:Uncharacterized protein n=1 Tax=Armillaria tabescens TaxID=1929756 RepID=A0AA39TT68_ARMTA|nr:uncharacterized protein EV420DRAFT_31998 [Desarmillaria tabescens]KAK0469422.1 hypothetical protein EV420DRAFT_31998 [Desarmillaria tabescens]